MNSADEVFMLGKDVLQFIASEEVGVGKPRLWVVSVIYHNPIGGTFLSRLTSRKSIEFSIKS